MSSFTLLTTHCADSDISGTYPAIQCGLNGSKEASVIELCNINGLDYVEHRVTGLNNIPGVVNSIENVIITCKAPTLEAFRDYLLSTLNN